MPTRDRGAIVITGASSGIGRACALRADRIGFTVFAGVRQESAAESIKGEASERLTPVFIDVTDEDSIEKAADEVAKAVGEAGLAGLVNNAGISIPGPVEVLPLSEFRRQMDVNFIGQIAVTQAFLPLLRKGRGRIVNIGSIGGRMATPFLGAYAASKFAMEGLTDAMRVELAPWDISVSIVEPGAIDTEIWEKGQREGDQLEAGMSPEGREMYRRQIDALRKQAEKSAQAAVPPSEVAKAVMHALASKNPKTRYLVGRDARMRAMLARAAPDRLVDRLIVSRMGLPKDV